MGDVLTIARVEAIFRDCLFREDEDTTGYVKAEGIMNSVGFHPERLESHRAEVEAMLDELPLEFHQEPKGKGGWSFLNACMDKYGNQWGEHVNMEQLFLLGMALGKVICPLSREMWPVLPGGMPYYMVTI